MSGAPVDYDDQVDSLLTERAALKASAEKWQTKLLASVFRKYNGSLLQDNLRISAINSELLDLSVQSVSEDSLEKISKALFPDATPERQAAFHSRAKTRQEAFSKLDDLTGQVTRIENTGSRQSTTSGYFKAAYANGKPVVLFRGWDGAIEQSDLIKFMDDLGAANPKARALLPVILGKVDINGKSYLAMEDLMAIGERANNSRITKEEFLDQCGDIFTAGFRKSIEQWGMDLGRTTLERDYIFVKSDGSIRLGVPFRAMDYIHDAKDMYAGLQTVPNPDHAGKPTSGIRPVTVKPAS